MSNCVAACRNFKNDKKAERVVMIYKKRDLQLFHFVESILQQKNKSSQRTGIIYRVSGKLQ